MTTEAQRIALAEAVGWLGIEYRDCEVTGRSSWLSGLNPKPDKILAVLEAFTGIERPPNESDYGWESLPNYAHDLNAMHDVEEWLNGDESRGYAYDTALCEVTGAYQDGPCNRVRLYHASAAQKLEAAVKSLGLWKEEA